MLLAGGFISAFAKNSTTFIIGRVLGGISNAGIAPLCLTVLTHITTEDERPLWLGIIVGSQGGLDLAEPL